MGALDRPGGGADEPDADGLVVPRAPRSVAVVRRYAVDACAALGWGDSTDTVALLVSEVATNAVLHARGAEIRVQVLDRGVRLRIVISDVSPVLPGPRRAKSGAEDGRGVAMVEALAVSWGVDARPDGTSFWFELGL